MDATAVRVPSQAAGGLPDFASQLATWGADMVEVLRRFEAIEDPVERYAALAHEDQRLRAMQQVISDLRDVAVADAAKIRGGQAELAAAAGITPPAVSRNKARAPESRRRLSRVRRKANGLS